MAGILTTNPLIFYYISVKSQNLDLKQEISYLEREGRGGGGEETEREKEK
jgi:hypothetical protein